MQIRAVPNYYVYGFVADLEIRSWRDKASCFIKRKRDRVFKPMKEKKKKDSVRHQKGNKKTPLKIFFPWITHHPIVSRHSQWLIAKTAAG